MNEKLFEKNKVSVVIPVYNEERFLRQALESVIDQVDYVIIGDNASTDGTADICQAFIKKYSQILYFKNEKNIGSVQNLSLCYEKVATEFVFHLGGHDLIPPGYVEELKNLLSTDQESICAFADILNFGDFHRDEILTFSKRFLEDIRNPDPYFRAWRHAHYRLSGIPCYGLFRSEIFLPFVKNIRPIGAESIYLFDCLLHYTFLYSPKTIFHRQQVHFEETGNEYYDDPMKRVYGQSNTSEMPSCIEGRFRMMAKDILEIYQNFNNEKYLVSKERYTAPLKYELCKLTGEKTGHFFYDLALWSIRTKKLWKKTKFRAGLKAIEVYFKKHFLPSWIKKRRELVPKRKSP